MVYNLDTVFAFGTYLHDETLVATRVSTVRDLYPKSKILVIGDGVYSSRLESHCAAHFATYFSGRRLKTKGFGGLWTARLLEFSLGMNPEFIIKADGDTGFLRPFSPSHPLGDLMGNIRSAGRWQYIQGGCVGFLADAARRILKSGLLGSERFQSSEYSYQRFGPDYLKAGEVASPELISLEDRILWEVATELGLTIQEWAEVNSLNPREVPSSEGFAVVHPWTH